MVPPGSDVTAMHDLLIVIMVGASVLGLLCVYAAACAREADQEQAETDIDLPPLDYRAYRRM